MAKQVIIQTAPSLEVWATFKAYCKAKGLSWYYLKRKKFPFTYKGFTVEKKAVN